MVKKKKACLLLLAAMAFAVVVAMGVGAVMTQLGIDTEAERLVSAYAREHGISYSSYPPEIIDLLERNPETEEFVLEYPEYYGKTLEIDLSGYDRSQGVPLFLQWDRQWGYIDYGSSVVGLTGCGPVCLSMAAYYLTGDDSMAPDRIVEFALEEGYYSPGNGSSWTLISEGGVKLGLDVTEIPLDENRILENLEVGNPIICAMGEGDFTTSGHYIVLVGCRDDGILVNDPNSLENSRKTWSYERLAPQIRNLWVLR